MRLDTLRASSTSATKPASRPAAGAAGPPLVALAAALALLGLAATLPAPAAAGLGKGSGEMGFGIGVTDFDSTRSADSSGSVFDIRGGYHLTRHFQVEGQTAVHRGKKAGVTTRTHLVMVNGVFNYHPTPRAVPYFLLGIGRAAVDVKTDGVSVDDTATAWQAAVGSRFFFRDGGRMALRFELSRFSERAFGDRAGNLSANLGLTWRLGT